MRQPGIVGNPRPRRAGWFRRALLSYGPVLVLAGCVVLGVSLYLQRHGLNKLEAVCTKLDQTDPSWRWDDLQADRPIVPDRENAALRVEAVVKLLPETWPSKRPSLDKETDETDVVQQVWSLDPAAQLSEALVEEARSEMDKAKVALAEARLLDGMRIGKYPYLAAKDVRFSSKWSYHPPQRKVADLLLLDAALRAQDRRPDLALASSRAAVGAGRSLSGDLSLLPLLVRLACQSVAIRSMERALAQGKPSEAALRTTQRLLEEELEQALLFQALRAERALEHENIGRREAGDLAGLWWDTGTPTEGFSGWLSATLDGPILRENHALLLELLTEAVEIAKLPLDEQHDKFQQLDQKAKAVQNPRTFLVGRSMPSVPKVADAFLRSRAELRCAIVALAAERYRLANGRWPDALEQLAPRLVPRVPLDPYDGKRLRYCRLEDGVVVYSVGPDGEDDAGKIDRQHYAAPGTDMGFRLWDVARRRQPPE